LKIRSQESEKIISGSLESRVLRIREIGSEQVYTGYLTFSF